METIGNQSDVFPFLVDIRAIVEWIKLCQVSANFLVGTFFHFTK
jgi:hypothetical protein